MSDVTQHLVASVVCYTARPEGLIQTLLDIAQQQDFHFQQSWELVLVDACFTQRHELVKFLWDRANIKGLLVHVPPLPPIGRDHYWNQDIPLYQHTGWSYARGDIIVQIEDYMTVNSDWLNFHVELVTRHPNLVSMGEVRSGSKFDGSNAPFYFSGPALDRQKLWLQKFPELKHRFANTASYGCANLTATEEWLSGNVAFATRAMLRARCFPEGPTHHPERVNVPVLLNLAGLSIWPNEDTPAWHASHGIAVVDHVITNRHGDLCESIPVKHTTASAPLPTDEIKIRDIVAERKRLGRWV